jgi:hypothetical protein
LNRRELLEFLGSEIGKVAARDTTKQERVVATRSDQSSALQMQSRKSRAVKSRFGYRHSGLNLPLLEVTKVSIANNASEKAEMGQ